PTASVERYTIVWTPLPATVTAVPAVQAWASSTLYSVAATPAPPSAATRCTVTAPALQPAGASSLVTGATVSIRTVAVRSTSMFPAASIERYATVCTPSPATATDVPAVQAGASSSLYSVTAT